MLGRAVGLQLLINSAAAVSTPLRLENQGDRSQTQIMENQAATFSFLTEAPNNKLCISALQLSQRRGK